MTPKEKAIELVEKFNFFPINNNTGLSKKIALICVNEIIISNPIEYVTWIHHENLQDKIDSAIDYLNEVKIEIKKL